LVTISFHPLSCVHFDLVFSFFFPSHAPASWLVSLPSLRTRLCWCLHTYIDASACFQPSSWTAWCLKMGPVCCPETQVTNCQPAPCDIPQEQRSQLQCSESLKSETEHCLFIFNWLAGRPTGFLDRHHSFNCL
jgi:hypothetical protein